MVNYTRDSKNFLYDPLNGFKHGNPYATIKYGVEKRVKAGEYMNAGKFLTANEEFIKPHERVELSRVIFTAIGNDKRYKYSYYQGIGNPKSGGKKK